MPRVKFYISYNGSRYHGWQRQKPSQRTIQGEIENHLSRISNQKVNVTASGRTDAGVHARVQVAHVNLPEETALLGGDRLLQSLNCMLPGDIRVLRIEPCKPNFHAIEGVKAKMYTYFINPNPICAPGLKDYTWHLRFPLDWEAMFAATEYLKGRHDFIGFAAADHSVKTTVRTLFDAQWGKVSGGGLFDQDLMALRLVGSGFLKQMVRSITGTLVMIGNRKAPPERVLEILQKKERRLVGPTAPPHGLWLWDILY